ARAARARLPDHRRVERHRRRRGAARRPGGLSRRPGRPLGGQAPRARRRARRRRPSARDPLRRDRVGRSGGARGAHAGAVRPARRGVRERGLRWTAGVPRRRRGRVARDGAHERLRGGAHDPGRAPGADGGAGSPAPDRLRGRATGPARVALLVHEVGGHGHGRGGPPGAERHWRPRDADRAGHGRHALLRQPADERPRGRRHRPRRHVRRLPAAARRRQRAADPPDRPGHL
ncbi:MAG: Short-chain dehydrogenase/reductase SDR, partial [uncultured Thermoleophilia bacterium]